MTHATFANSCAQTCVSFLIFANASCACISGAQPRLHLTERLGNCMSLRYARVPEAPSSLFYNAPVAFALRRWNTQQTHKSAIEELGVSACILERMGERPYFTYIDANSGRRLGSGKWSNAAERFVLHPESADYGDTSYRV